MMSLKAVVCSAAEHRLGGGGGDHDGGNASIESELEIMGKSGVEV